MINKTPFLDGVIKEYTEGLKQFYPEMQVSSRFSIYSGDEPRRCEFELQEKAKNLSGTDYECKELKQIIHYTGSIQTVGEILNGGVLRLPNLKTLNDPKEFAFLVEELGMHFTNEQINNHKQYFYSASFCKKAGSEDEEFPMWRLYGNDGYGAAIVFDIENPNENWHNFQLCNVQYGKNPAVDLYRTYYNWHQQLQKKYNDPFTNFPSALLSILALHKNDIWRYEKEVRLSTRQKFDAYSYKDKKPHLSTLKHGITKAGVPYSYIELPLANGHEAKRIQKKLIELKEPNFLYLNAPMLNITKVILGYRFKDTQLYKIQRYFDHFSELYNRSIVVERSQLSKYM